MNRVMVAPRGTRITATDGWRELGVVESITYEQETEQVHSWANGSRVSYIPNRSIHVVFEDGRELYAPSASFKTISPTEVEISLNHLNYYSIPQRYVLGTDQENHLAIASADSRSTTYKNGIGRTIELGTNGFHPQIEIPSQRQTVLTSEDVADFAYELFNKSAKLPKALVNLPASAQPFISAGTGESQARVFSPKNEEQAKRNLNFAIANLKAYQQWEKVTKPALERKKQEDLARLEAEAKAKAEAEAKKREIEAKQVARNKAGLDLYNKVIGGRYLSWGSIPYTLSLSTREKWNDKAEELAKLKRESDPFQITVDTINAGSISAARLSNRLFDRGGYSFNL